MAQVFISTSSKVAEQATALDKRSKTILSKAKKEIESAKKVLKKAEDNEKLIKAGLKAASTIVKKGDGTKDQKAAVSKAHRIAFPPMRKLPTKRR